MLAKELRKERTGYHAQISLSINRRLLAFDSFNVARQEERTRLAKTAHKGFDNGLVADYAEEAFRHDLDLFCRYLPETWENSPERIGDPAVLITTSQCPIKPEWLLKPLIHKGQPTLIFADGGSGKSVFAEIVATVVGLAWRDNPLRMTPAALPVKTLYLDWETDEEELRWRLCALKEGIGLEEVSFLYRACYRAFHLDVDRILRIVKTENVGLIIVDSLGGACGADLKEAEAANEYFRAMRVMSCASLTLTHITKEGREGKASPFGSAYFWNWARSVWEMRKSQEEGEDSLTIALHHRKANNTRKFQAMGYKFSFFHDGDDLREVSVKRVEVATDPELSKGLPLSQRILSHLAGGAVDPKDLAEDLETTSSSIRGTCNRMKREGLVTKVGKRWALPAQEEPF